MSSALGHVSMVGMKLIGFTMAAGILFSLSSCSLFQQQPQETGAAAPETVKKQENGEKKKKSESDEEIRPSQEQMEHAMQALKEEEEEASTLPQEESAEASNATTDNASEPPRDVTDAGEPQADFIPGGLRMGRFAPPEEAVSSSENDEPAPNSVELHGFRSPNLKGGKLPMNINGKINKPE